MNLTGGRMFGQMVADKRKAQGKSQRQLAADAGITRVYVSEIERGNVANPTAEMLFALARALDTDAAAFLVALTPPPETDAQKKGA